MMHTYGTGYSMHAVYGLAADSVSCVLLAAISTKPKKRMKNLFK